MEFSHLTSVFTLNWLRRLRSLPISPWLKAIASRVRSGPRRRLNLQRKMMRFRRPSSLLSPGQRQLRDDDPACSLRADTVAIHTISQSAYAPTNLGGSLSSVRGGCRDADHQRSYRQQLAVVWSLRQSAGCGRACRHLFRSSTPPSQLVCLRHR